MLVAVVNVGSVRVFVTASIVVVGVAVLADDRRVMDVIVMTVVVPMRVFVIQRLVRVPVAMGFGQMQVHAEGEQQRCTHRP